MTAMQRIKDARVGGLYWVYVAPPGVAPAINVVVRVNATNGNVAEVEIIGGGGVLVWVRINDLYEEVV